MENAEKIRKELKKRINHEIKQPTNYTFRAIAKKYNVSAQRVYELYKELKTKKYRLVEYMLGDESVEEVCLMIEDGKYQNAYGLIIEPDMIVSSRTWN